MAIIINILVFLATISILVLIHEYGHFWVARRLGIKVERFSLGFGAPIFRWHGKDGVEYVISWALLGGYVKLNEDSYGSKSTWARMLVMVAGVVANLLLAVLIFWLVYMVGFVQPKTVIGKILPRSIAAKAGLRKGAEITTVDNKFTATWQQVAIRVLARVGDKGSMKINGHSLVLKSWYINESNPQPLQSLGIVPYFPPVPAVIERIVKGGPASKIGFQNRDKVLAINGYKIKDWFSLIKYIQQKPGQELKFILHRLGKQIQLLGRVGSKSSFLRGRRVGYLGVMSPPVNWPKNMLKTIKYSTGRSFIEAMRQTGLILDFNFTVVVKLIAGKMSYRVLGGPITIFVSADEAFQQGLTMYFMFLALLSVMLAFVNILPIPALDGGNFVLLLIEAILRRPIPEKVQFFILKIGFSILALIIFVAVGNDLLRFFQ